MSQQRFSASYFTRCFILFYACYFFGGQSSFAQTAAQVAPPPTLEEQLFTIAEPLIPHTQRSDCDEAALQRAVQALAIRGRADLALRLGGATQFADAPEYRVEILRLTARAKAVKGDIEGALAAVEQMNLLLKEDSDSYLRMIRLDALLAVARAALRAKDNARARTVLAEASKLVWQNKPDSYHPLHAYVAMLVSRAGDTATALELFRKLEAYPNQSLFDKDRDSATELSANEVYRLRAGFDLPLRNGKSPYPTLVKRHRAAPVAAWHPNITKSLSLARAVSDPWARAVILSEVAIRRQVAFGDGTPIVDEIEKLLPAALQALQTRKARNLNPVDNESVGRSGSLISLIGSLYEALAGAGRFEAAEKLHGRLTQIITSMPDGEYDVVEPSEVRPILSGYLYHAYMAGHVWPRLDAARRQRIIAAAERSEDDMMFHLRLCQVAESMGDKNLMRRMVQKFGETALRERVVTADSPTSEVWGLLITATGQKRKGFPETANTLLRRAQPLLKRMTPLERAGVFSESGMLSEAVMELSTLPLQQLANFDYDLLGFYAATRTDYKAIPEAFHKIKPLCAGVIAISKFLIELSHPTASTLRKEEEEMVFTMFDGSSSEMRSEEIEREEWKPFVPAK